MTTKYKKKWKDEDIEFLESKWGITPLNTLAKKLGRTSESVYQKAYRLGLEQMCFRDLTLTGATKILGVSKDKVLSWEKQGLRLKRKKMINSTRTYVEERALLNFLKKHQHDFDATKIEQYALGSEPEWLRLKRFSDTESNLKSRKAWTEIEEQRLIALLRVGLTQAAIAKEIGRSESAIENRIRSLRSRNISIRSKQLPWTDAEIEIMLDLELQGFTDKQIGEEIGRTTFDITDKRKRLRMKGEYPYASKAERLEMLGVDIEKYKECC